MTGAEHGAADAAEETASPHGLRFDALGPEERARVLALAFDYRGDVTLTLAGGTTISGYVFSHHPDGAEPYLRMFPQGRDEKVTVRHADIVGIHFSGKDTASGRSWRAWVARYEEKARLLAEGVDVGSIEPQPEALE